MSHVVIMLVDALRADHLGCYAGEDTGTPNVDELARQGIVFRNAISQAPWTRPSVASLMTGLYPSQHGLVDRVQGRKKGRSVAALDPAVPTLAEILAANGHATAAFLGGNANLKPVFGLTRGFDHVRWRPTTDGAVIVEDFEQWIQGQRPGQSFSYLHFMDVHNPLPGEIIASRLDGGLDLQLVSESMHELTSCYAASVRRVDHHIGRVVQALESSRILDDAWVVVTADHGEELMEHGAMLAHGRTLYRELVRVPLIVRLPGGAHAREINDLPVQLIDLLPSVLDYLGYPPPDVPGRSVLPLLRGEDTGTRTAAFSELHRKDRYIRSITTATHQLIENYLLQETSVDSSADLRPGQTVAIWGESVQGASFLATKVSLESGDGTNGYRKLRGRVEVVDSATGSLTVTGVTSQVNGITEFVGLDGEPFGLTDLAVGDKVTVWFVVSDGRLVPTKIIRDKSGAKSKIKGIVERVQDLEQGLRSVSVLGIKILIPDGVRVSASRQNGGTRKLRNDALTRVLAGDYISKQRELYDVTCDPAETCNIVDQRPDIAQELGEMLAGWTETLVGRVHTDAGHVDVDPETLDQLRRMGYVD
jgi:arylsulfatase A-like enzyme